MAESIHDRVKRDRETVLTDTDLVPEFRRYAQGKQRGTISVEQKQILGSVWGHDYADNVCDLILSAAANRLELTGWRVESTSVQDFLDELYTKNQIGDFSNDVHYRAPRDGNDAIGLSWLPDNAPSRSTNTDAEINDPEIEVPQTRGSGRVVFHHEDWWDGKDTGVFVGYDDSGLPSYAVKDFEQWLGDPPHKRRRRVVYFPDHFERYIMEGQGWQFHRLDSDPPGGQDGIVPWLKTDGSPLGIPIVHVPSSRFGKAPYGVSDLAGGIMGQQDHLNDLQVDLIAAARMTAFQMVAIEGAQQTEKVRVGPGRVLSVGPNGRIHELAAGDLSQLINAIKQKLESIARNSATPAHEITGGDWPSGVALMRSEIRFVSKIQRMAKTIGPAWSTVAHRATEIANAFGGLGLDENILIQAVFAPPEKLDALALAEVDLARVKVYDLLQGITDPELMAKTGLVTLDEANAIATARSARAVATPVVAAF